MCQTREKRSTLSSVKMSNSGALALCSLAALVALALGIAVLSGPEAPPSRLTTPATWQVQSPEQDAALDRIAAPAVTQPHADVDFITESSPSATEGATRPDQANSAEDDVEPVRAVKTKTAPLSGRPLGDGPELPAPRQLANGKSIFGY